jgi:RNA-binding protein YhbY
MMLHQHSSSSSSSSSRAAVLYPLAAVLLCGVFLETSSFVAQAFVPATNFHRPLQQSSFTTKQGQEEIMCRRVVSRLTSTEPSAVDEEEDENDDDEDDDDEDISFLFEEPPVPLDPIEQVWRYAKKPLLRIGSKGATHSHGNSLRQLLEDHTIVKVKVNTKKFQNSVQQAYEVLKGLAVENGASPDIELIQLREGTNEILFAMPGTLAKMEEGTFPPPPPVVEEDENGKDDDATTNEPSNELTA